VLAEAVTAPRAPGDDEPGGKGRPDSPPGRTENPPRRP
jgi:hypothetical protein